MNVSGRAITCQGHCREEVRAGLLTKLSIWIVSQLLVVHCHAMRGRIWRADRHYAGGHPRPDAGFRLLATGARADLITEGEEREHIDAVGL